MLTGPFHLCMLSLHFMHYICSLTQTCRKHAKKISGIFKNSDRVGLAVLKKIVTF